MFMMRVVIRILVYFFVFGMNFISHALRDTPDSVSRIRDCNKGSIKFLGEFRDKQLADSEVRNTQLFSYDGLDRDSCLAVCFETDECNLVEVSASQNCTLYHATEVLTRSANGVNLLLISECEFQLQWQKVDNPRTIGWISVGQAGVWGLHFIPNGRGEVYYLQETYGDNRPSTYTWEKVDGHLNQLSVGTDIFTAVNHKNVTYWRKGIDPTHPTGAGWPYFSQRLTQVSIRNETGELWGTIDNEVWHWTNTNTYSGHIQIHIYRPQQYLRKGDHWVQRATGIKYVSAGITGVWGINVNDRVVYRGYDDTSFTPVSGDGEFTQITSEGSTYVVAISTNSKLYYRTGITTTNPVGVDWEFLECNRGDVRQAFVYQNEVWVTLTNEEAWWTKLTVS